MYTVQSSTNNVNIHKNDIKPSTHFGIHMYINIKQIP